MFADACRPGYDIDADQAEVPETAQFCLPLDGDVERAAKLDCLVHPRGSGRLVGGIDGIGDVVGSPDLRAEEIEKLFRLRIDAA